MKATTERQAVASVIGNAILTAKGVLEKRTNGKGNDYFTTGMVNCSPIQHQYTDESGVAKLCTLGVTYCVNVLNIKNAAAQAIVTQDTIAAQAEKLPADERAALIERLMSL